MTYYYDTCGWLTDEVLPGRETAIVPPEAQGDMHPNFTGHAWVLQRYVQPPAPEPSERDTLIAKLASLEEQIAEIKALI